MTSPTREEIQTAYEALETLTNTCIHSSDLAEELQELVLRALPPNLPLSMADIEWDDKEHRLSGAEHRHFGNGIMLCENGDKSIAFIHEDGMEAVKPEHLIPNGKHYYLQETNNG